MGGAYFWQPWVSGTENRLDAPACPACTLRPVRFLSGWHLYSCGFQLWKLFLA